MRVRFGCIRVFGFEWLLFVLHFVLHPFIVDFSWIVSAGGYKHVKPNHLNLGVSCDCVVVICYSVIFLLLLWSWNINFVTTVSMDWQAFHLCVFLLGINIWITTIRGLWSWAQRSRSMELNNTCEKKRIVVLGMFSQKENYLNCWKNFIHVLISLCYSICKHYFSIALCSQLTIYLTYASNVAPWYLYRDASHPKWYGRHCHQNHLIFSPQPSSFQSTIPN